MSEPRDLLIQALLGGTQTDGSPLRLKERIKISKFWGEPPTDDTPKEPFEELLIEDDGTVIELRRSDLEAPEKESR